MNWVANEIHFAIETKEGGTVAIYIIGWTLKKYSCILADLEMIQETFHSVIQMSGA